MSNPYAISTSLGSAGFGGTYVNTPVKGPLNTNQYPFTMDYHNYGTLEGELGKFTDSKGMIYLDKVYTIQDSSTNVLSYNGKKFLMNRGSVMARIDEINSMQVIEIDNTDTDITITSKFITQ